MRYWAMYAACTAMIVFSGVKLSRYGDVLAGKSGLGRTWIGVVLMASVTSLPELITGLSSVTYAGVPDIAAGDALGSCAFNLLILALLDVLQRPLPLSTRAHHGHTLSAGFGILLLCIASLGLTPQNRSLPIGWIGGYSLLLLGVYLVAMRMIYMYEKKRVAAFAKERSEEPGYDEIPMRSAALNYALHAGIIILAASALPLVGKGIAESTALGQTFVGNFFIAASTSLPEVVVCLAALRMGAVDLAIGNLLGSNIFNVGLILAADDFFFTTGPILSSVDPSHAVSAISAVAMSSIAILGFTYRAGKKRLWLAWDSIGMVAVYLVNLLILFTMRG
jgi:cation:H+ antiporter